MTSTDPIPVAFAIDGVARHYAWGSLSAIPELLGQPVSDTPVAELWFGAHPDDPSSVPEHGSTLEALIAAAPEAVLGADVVARFGPRLPFLVKLLAAERPLSIQVHPTKAQAEAGFAAEQAAGVPADAAERTYRDANHKPELLFALTPFEALCGFRSPADIRAVLAELAVPALDPIRACLDGPRPLLDAFTALLGHTGPGALSNDVAAAVAAARDRLPAGVGRAVELAAAEFPGDIGVVLTLLLNYVRLQPGQAIFLAAGTVHSYLRGLGVEVLANSDNVLRCGLTPKHVDVPALLATATFAPSAEPCWPAISTEPPGRGFRPPIPDFALTVLELDGTTRVTDPAAQLVLCTAGQVRVECADTVLELSAGRAAFVRSRPGPVELRGSGQVCLAHVAVAAARGIAEY